MFNQLFESIIIGFKSVFSNKGRALLTMLGIIIGILSVSVMGTAINGIDNVFDDTMGMFKSDVLYVQQFPWFMGNNEWWEFRNRPRLKEEYVEKLSVQAKTVSMVNIASERTVTLSRESYTSDGVQVKCESWQSVYVDAPRISSGRYFTQMEDKRARKVMVIGADVKKALFPEDQDPVGEYVRINGIKYKVIGIYAEQGKVMGMFSVDNMAVIPYQTGKAVFGRFWWNSIGLKINEEYSKEEAIEEIRFIMRKLRGLRPLDADDFSINQQEVIEKELGSVKSTIGIVGIGISALSLLVGGIGIMNIMFVSVKERTKEIGIRKALGAKRWVIMVQFLFEAVIIALLGGIVGLLLTFPLVGLINKFFVASMSLGLVIIALLVSISVGVLSGIIPASKAAGLDPIDAMRYE